ncbi:major facilitator superfamily domain-containing protein [Aspergillus alliaceus]|uniref:major facilitator superfamily domain-containing protein n=1 Tax=Petromyces alliaceus TaxID=209559 RepID=UPI0012A3F70F|nr:major facilitator superfamily domain-containing protein [Aspergillus alliaceus]KAB8227283.1 major facilitator superfamily domain-containing protein [Aspergillus alliaceus]
MASEHQDTKEQAASQIRDTLWSEPHINTNEATTNVIREISHLSKENERKLRLKIDLYVIPTVSMLWLFCFIDRANIGNARIAGMDASLKLQGYDYNIILSCFYISYILFEVPTTILCKQIGPGWFIPTTSLLFGVCSIATAFVQTHAQICGLRFLLGAFEAGMLPAIAYYLSRWYKRAELAFRLSLCLVMSPLAGAFSGILASAILQLNRFGSLTQWRMIFGIEGIITLALSGLSYFVLTDRPETAIWLSAEEKYFCELRLKQERVGQTEIVDHIDRVKLLRGALNPITLLTAVVFFFSNITVQGLGVFLPTIISAIYPEASTIRQQLYSVPPYIVGAFFDVAVPALSWKLDRRQILIVLSTPTIIIGYVLLLASHSATIRYMACFFIASTAFVVGPLSSAQVSANVVSDTSRASAIATNVLFGNLGGIVSSWSYIVKDSPDYYTGNGLNLASGCMQFMISVGVLVWMQRDNKERSHRNTAQELAGLNQREIEHLDWTHPAFRWRP